MPALRVPTPAHLSPLLLAQEFVKGNPWRLLTVCILLNRTNGMKQVKPMLADFFDSWPNPSKFLAADVNDVKKLIKPLGFQNIRYDRLLGMTTDVVSGKRPPKDKIKGVGLYAIQSYEIFVGGYLVQDPHDKELKAYVKWAEEERRGGNGSEIYHVGR